MRWGEERRGGTGEYNCVIMLVVVDNRWGYWLKLVRVRVFLKTVVGILIFTVTWVIRVLFVAGRA